jgi:cysteinyl-tRNA synthetase
MDDDFNTGAAVGVLFELAPAINKFADDAKLETSAAAEADRAVFRHAAGVVRELMLILGLDSAPAIQQAAVGLAGQLLDLLVDLRNQARKSKDFKLSDAIRDRLKALGVTIEDRAEGSQWKIGSPS